MRHGEMRTGKLSAPDGSSSSQMRNAVPFDGQQSFTQSTNVSDGTSLRDRLTDDGRDGPDVPIYKQDLGSFIEGGDHNLNSQSTRDRNPGGAPNFPLDPYR